MERTERRGNARFLLILPMTVRWVTRSGIAEAETESRDISSTGIYFSLPIPVERGTAVEIMMTLPHQVTGNGQTRVRCHGRILRTDALGESRVGVATQIENYQFVRDDEVEQTLSVA